MFLASLAFNTMPWCIVIFKYGLSLLTKKLVQIEGEKLKGLHVNLCIKKNPVFKTCYQ